MTCCPVHKRTYGLPTDVEPPARETLPDESYTAFLLGQDEVLRRLSEASVDTDDVLETVVLRSDFGIELLTGSLTGDHQSINWYRGRGNRIDYGPTAGTPLSVENVPQEGPE
jgi:hypothetical protein